MNARITHASLSLLLAAIACGLVAAQSFSPLWAPASGNIVQAYCYDPSTGNIVPYCNVVIGTNYYSGSNSHTHYSPTAPLSTANPSSGNTGLSGYLQVTIATTIVGHAEWAYVCVQGTSNCQTMDYGVGVAGIYWVSDHGIWIQNGATQIHGNSVSYNHWMTSNAAYGYYNATVAYQQNHPGKVYSNDMALPYGGKFDLSAGWGVNPNESHLSHDWGTAADTDLIPQAYVNEFLGDCSKAGAVDTRQEGNGSLHCRWSY